VPKRTQLVGALLVRDGAVLLGWRGPLRRSFPSCWDVIGGHVERGETLEQALFREVEEEVGVTPTRYARLASADVDDALRLTVYRVDAWSGGEPALRGDEHTELRWFPFEAACELTDLASPRYRTLFRGLSRARAVRPADPTR
jgi:8-oxo-dGTP pyrophosphatase MutT (NUDIX family)